MRTLGLIGGMSWESTQLYYRLINQQVNDALGGLHSAQLLLYSCDFQQIQTLQMAGKWDEAANVLSDIAVRLENAGADALLICTNTMHKVAPQIEHNITIPLLHIADGTAHAIKAQGIDRIALLGTRYTMEQDFYKGRLSDKHGLDVIVPDEDARTFVHTVIFDELCKGEVKQSSRQAYQSIITDLVTQGAQGVILGCTEIGLLVQQTDCQVPVFDTTQLHVRQAVNYALEPSKGSLGFSSVSI